VQVSLSNPISIVYSTCLCLMLKLFYRGVAVLNNVSLSLCKNILSGNLDPPEIKWFFTFSDQPYKGRPPVTANV
jgi:hypothetical protein